MEKNIDGKMKSVASIPANYVSILQLQERWLKEKGRKQIDKDSGMKQQQVDDEQVKAMEPKVKLDEKGLGSGFRLHRGDNLRKKEPNCVEVCATVSEKKEDGVNPKVKKKKRSKNKSEKLVKCESKAYVPTEDSPVKEENGRVFTSKREDTCRDSISQFQNLWLEKRVEEEGREVKEPARLNSGQGYERNQRHGWSSRREIRATGTMVWVKKGKNDGVV